MKAYLSVGNCHIRIIEGDLTELAVDAIVNAANAALILGGGVAGAIKAKGGSSIQRECDQIGGTVVGGAVITGAGNLQARYVIHAVGPRLGEGDEASKLKDATWNSLNHAKEKSLRSIAFPAISTGIFGYPVEKCAEILLQTTIEFLQKYQVPDEVIFCLWGTENFNLFRKRLAEESLKEE